MWQNINNNTSQYQENLSKSDQEISSQMTDLDFLDILLGGGHSSRSQGHYNSKSNSHNHNNNNNFFPHRNRTLSCSSVVMEDFGSNKSCCSEDGGILEHWEPGEILERSFSHSQFPRETHSEPGTPHKIQVRSFKSKLKLKINKKYKNGPQVFRVALENYV
jgi:hypothetical protein